MSEQLKWDPYGQQEQVTGGVPADQRYELPVGEPSYQGQWSSGPPGGHQVCPGSGYGSQLRGKRTHWLRNMLSGVAAVVVVGAALSAISSGVASPAASAAVKPAAARTLAIFSGSGQENTPEYTVTEAWELAAGAGEYGAWAWSEGDMPRSISSGLGGTQAQAETAAVQACDAAGGGSGGSGKCYARSWFENAYSSFAYDASDGYWGVSDASTSTDADSTALSYCSEHGAKDCGIVGRARHGEPHVSQWGTGSGDAELRRVGDLPIRESHRLGRRGHNPQRATGGGRELQEGWWLGF